jgi:predicted DNA-binding mobile mystery protein A
MLQDLPLSHLDEQLGPLRGRLPIRPRVGWLRAIREALGMTGHQFAKAAGTAVSTVQAAERSEAKGDIALATLARYAEVLGCDLHYVLVPRTPLRQMVDQRADAIARREVAAVHHSMALEDQATSHEQMERQVADLRRKLLEGPRSRLWT